MGRAREYRLRDGETVYVLPQGEVTIGRDAACDIQLDGDLVSRRHATIHVGAAGILFDDQGSSNGSRVNDVRVAGPIRLWPGDRVRIGFHQLDVEASSKPIDSSPTLRLVHCPACGAFISYGMAFCVQCGTHLEGDGRPYRCKACDEEVPAGEHFCPNCGERVGAETRGQGASLAPMEELSERD